MKQWNLRDLGDGRARGVIPVAGGEGLPVWCLTGQHPGPTLVLTAGVHGCEYIGILALRQLFDRTVDSRLWGQVLMLPLVNAAGFYQARRQIVPEDGKNINRVFPPPPHGTRAERIAEAIVSQLYPRADFLLDLHGGDVGETMTPLVFYPATAAPAVTARAVAGAAHLAVDYRIASRARDGLYSWAAQQGIAALLLEIGQMGLWSRELVELELRSIRSLMGHLQMGPTPQANVRQQNIEQMCYAEAETAGFWFARVKPQQRVCAGQILGVIEDLEGRLLQTVRAKWDGMVLYHTVQLGVQAGEALVAYGRLPFKQDSTRDDNGQDS